MTATRTPYEVLGVSEEASRDEIRRAYRKLILRYHPDRNPGDARAAEAFLSVREAFDTLQQPEHDAGYDANRVAEQMRLAAEEAERRRRGAGIQGRAWQQARIALDRPRADHYREAARTPRAIGGAVLGVAVVVAAVVFRDLAAPYLGGPALAVLAGLALGIGVAAFALLTAPTDPWAVETHWQGLRDLRWDVRLPWTEIQSAASGEGYVDLVLSDRAWAHVKRKAPPETFAGTGVYRLPLSDSRRLMPIIRSKVG